MQDNQILDLHKGIATLENAVKSLTDSNVAQSAAMTKSNEILSDVLIEMRENRIKEEYMNKRVDTIQDKQDSFISEFRPTLVRSRKMQSNRDDFTKGLNSSAGRLVVIGVVSCAGIVFAHYAKLFS